MEKTSALAGLSGSADPRGHLTSVFPGDILQNQVRVFRHVFLKPGPTVDLLVSWRNHEETGRKTQK